MKTVTTSSVIVVRRATYHQPSKGRILTRREKNSMCSLRFFLVWGACFAVLVSELPAGEGVRPKDEQAEGVAPGKAGGKKGAAKKRRSSWVPVDEGLGRVRKKYLPAIILFEESQSPLGEGGGGNPVSPSASFLRSHLSKGRLRSVLKKFVLIRVSREDLKRVYPDSLPIIGSRVL